MKVLIVNKFLHPNGGSETYIFEIGRCLETMGHEVQYFGMEHEGRVVGNHAGVYADDIDFHNNTRSGRIVDGIRKLTYPFKIIHSRTNARKMMLLLEDFKPDIVHFNNINFQLTPSVIEAVADYDIIHKTQTKVVYTAHDSQWVCPGHLLRVPSDGRRCFDCEGGRFINCVRNRCIHGSRIRSLVGAFEAWYYRKHETYSLVDIIICPSNFMKRTLETDPELRGKCIVMHNFVPGYDPDIRKSGDGSPYVLYFGRYSDEKGLDTLLKVCEDLKEVKFVFAGSGPLKSEIDRLDNITDVGFKNGDELKSLITGARFTVFPSECQENCSFTVLESVAYETPVIASNTGGTPELVKDGINGMLFNPGDEETLSELVRQMWTDTQLVKKLQEGCRNSRPVSVSDYCHELEKLYLEKA